MTVRDSRKFDEKFGKKKVGQQIWEICLLRDLPAEFSPKKKLHERFLDRRLRVQNLMKNLSSFLPTGLGSPLFIYFSLKKK